MTLKRHSFDYDGMASWMEYYDCDDIDPLLAAHAAERLRLEGEIAKLRERCERLESQRLFPCEPEALPAPEPLPPERGWYVTNSAHWRCYLDDKGRWQSYAHWFATEEEANAAIELVTLAAEVGGGEAKQPSGDFGEAMHQAAMKLIEQGDL